MSQTQAIHVSMAFQRWSAEARNNGGIAVNTGKISAEGYYAGSDVETTLYGPNIFTVRPMYVYRKLILAILYLENG